MARAKRVVFADKTANWGCHGIARGSSKSCACCRAYDGLGVQGGKKFASDDGALNQPASEASVEMGFLQAGELRQRGVKMPTHNEIEEERRNEGQRTAGHEEGIADSQICAA